MTRDLPTPTADDAARMIGDPVGWVTSLLPSATNCRVCGDPADEHCTTCARPCPEDHCPECGACVEHGYCTDGCDDSDED